MTALIDAAILALIAAGAAWIAGRELESRRWALRTLAYLAPGLALALAFASAPRLAALCLGATAILVIAIAEIDARRQIIPDALVLALALVAIPAPFAGAWSGKLIGAIGLGALFVAARQAYFAWRREEGLGLGDVKLAAVMGALLGVLLGLAAVAAAALATIAWLVATRRGALLAGAGAAAHEARAAPFGVGLAAALVAFAALRLAGAA